MQRRISYVKRTNDLCAMQRSPDRRRFLQSTALASLAATAGCLSIASSSESDPGDEEATANPTDSPVAADENTSSDSTCQETDTSTQLTPPESLEDWLADANGYDGEPTRKAGSQVDIRVGESVDGEMAFAPAVIEVAPMTRVTWDWTGHGGRHNVVALDGTFDSGQPNAQAGISYEYIFDETGEYPFASEPDLESGMKGAVIVREPPSTGNQTVDMWMRDVENFDGTVTDRTGSSVVTITVGAEGNGGSFGFAPAVLKVTTGTTVKFEWTGDGGAHNVVFENAGIHSGEVTHEPGIHFQHTFEESGTYRYTCQPHRALGQKGAIIVE